MALSSELITRYTTEVDVDWRHAFVLFHPIAGTIYTIAASEVQYKTFDGATREFIPVPAAIVTPKNDDSGTEEMGIAWSCVGDNDGNSIEDYVLQYLEAACADTSQRIVCKYTIYLDDDPDPQIDPPIEYGLTNVTVSPDGIAAVATRADILNRTFPREIYRVDRYPGLRRR